MPEALMLSHIFPGQQLGSSNLDSPCSCQQRPEKFIEYYIAINSQRKIDGGLICESMPRLCSDELVGMGA